MLKLGMKSSCHPEQLYDRLKYKPEIIELHLYDDDLFGEKRKQLENTIFMLMSLGHKVYLHHPGKYNGRFLNIIHEQQEDYLYFHLSTRILAEISAVHSVKCVIHPHYLPCPESALNEKNKARMFAEIEQILDYAGDAFLWENSIEGLFTAANPTWLEDFIKPLNLPLTYDISHAFISFKGDNRLLQEQIKDLDGYIRYFHVVDSEGKKHDGLPLGSGTIDWKPILPFLLTRPYIYEINLKNKNDAAEMYNSHLYLVNLLKES